jgi:hypothetical protein
VVCDERSTAFYPFRSLPSTLSIMYIPPRPLLARWLKAQPQGRRRQRCP